MVDMNDTVAFEQIIKMAITSPQYILDLLPILDAIEKGKKIFSTSSAELQKEFKTDLELNTIPEVINLFN